MFDMVGDYYIRCSKCHRSTNSDDRLLRLANDWNEGKCPNESDSTPFERFCGQRDQPIRKIAFREDAAGFETGRFSCESLILFYDDHMFQLESYYIPMDRGLFAVSEISGYNPKLRPYVLDPGKDYPLRLLEHNREGSREKLVLSNGKQTVIVMAGKGKLEVEICRD